MKSFKVGLAGALLIMALGGFAQAANTADISVSVQLQPLIEVSVTPNTWAIPNVSLSGVSDPTTFIATVGNTTTKLDIISTDSVGGWTLGTRGAANVFEVDVADPVLVLSTTNQSLGANVAPYGQKAFCLTYKAPVSENKGAGIAQDFTITIKASAP